MRISEADVEPLATLMRSPNEDFHSDAAVFGLGSVPLLKRSRVTPLASRAALVR